MRSLSISLVLLASLAVSCSEKPQTATTPEPTKPAQAGPSAASSAEGCRGFSAGDAAAFLNVAPGKVTSSIEHKTPSLWLCSFSAPGGGLSFSITVSKDAAEATREMQDYRENLELAAELKPFKDLPQGAYSDIMGLGEDAVWSEVNKTLTVRKGHVTVQVQEPFEKMAQIKAAEAILKKL
jgi:hypothetical protein